MSKNLSNEELLKKAKNMPRGYKKVLYVMSIVNKELKKQKLTSVIIGGAAVEFYTRNWYATLDIDLAIDETYSKKTDSVFKKLGFKKEGRAWIREDIDIEIETPAKIETLNKDKILNIKTENGSVNIIGIEDLIVDRIAAAKHWKSEQDKVQAIEIGSLHFDKIDWDYIREKCINDHSEDEYRIILDKIKNENNRS